MKKTLFFMAAIALLGMEGCAPAIYTKAISGVNYTTGDTIQFGAPRHNWSSFSYVGDVDGTVFVPAKENLSGCKAKIVAIDKYILQAVRGHMSDSKGILWVMLLSNPERLWGSYYVDIDRARNAGEVIIKANPTHMAANIMDDTTALAYFAKTSGQPLDHFVDEYMYRFMRKLYTESRNDEFQRNSAKAKAAEILQKQVAQVNVEQNYLLYTTLTLGDYDFTKKGFAVQLPKDAAFDVLPSATSDANEFKPISLVLNLTNANFVAVPEGEANMFLQRRKDNFGDIDRKVYAVVLFRAQKSTDGYKRIIDGQPVSIELYDFPIQFANLRYNWIGTINVTK